MSRTWRKPLALLTAVVCLTLAAQPAQAQFAVVTIKSVDDVMDNVRLIMEKAGQKDQAKLLDVGLLFLTGGKGLAGIDTKKPLGLYVGLPDGGNPPVIGFIPVTKQDDVLDLVKNFKIKVSKPEKEVYTLTGEDGKDHYVRFANGHAYICENAEPLQGKLPEPSKFLPADSKTHLAAASLRLGQLPKQAKLDAVDQMVKQLEADKQKKENETDAQYQGRLIGMKIGQDIATTFILDSEDLSFSIQIDPKTEKFIVDFSVTAAPNSPLANNTKALGTLRSKFDGLSADSTFAFLCALPLSKEVQADIGKLIEKSAKEELDKETDPTKKKLGQQALQIVTECFGTGSVDFGMFFTSPSADKTISMVGGIGVKEGKKFDKFMRTALKDLAKDEQGEVKLDFAKIGSLSVHRITPKKSVDEKTEKTFGSSDVYLVFRDDVILYSLGKNGLEAMKDAVARLDKAPAKNSAPFLMDFSFRRIAEMGDAFKPEEAEAIRKVFVGADKDKDHMRISLLGGSSLRLRFDMDFQMIKLFAELGALKQK